LNTQFILLNSYLNSEKMKQKISLSLFAFICLFLLSSHDLFIKMDTFYLGSNVETTISLYNGTFGKSEAVLARDRMVDVSLVNPGQKSVHPNKSHWYEENNQTLIKFKTGDNGTGVFGVSTSTRVGDFTPETFISNMKHEGLFDVLEERKKAGEEGNAVKKKYSKHVKAIFQVGRQTSDDYKAVLGYPIEFVPLDNPYSVRIGGELSMQLLIDGKPAAGEMVYASYNDKFGHENDTALDVYQIKTDKDGIVKIKITERGHWYFRTVNLKKSSEKDADYVSLSASLTFEARY
jgi:Domain of unknown function (DUF4198)